MNKYSRWFKLIGSRNTFPKRENFIVFRVKFNEKAVDTNK